MRFKGLFLLALALLFGGIAAYMVNSTLESQVINEQVDVVQPTEAVVVAAVDLPAGLTLEPLHLRTVNFPVGTTPEDSYRAIEDLMANEPPVVVYAMRQNEVILADRLSTGVLRRGLTTRIPDGLRAISIPVNEVRGVGGFVLPGDRVDVLHTTTVGRRDEKPVSRTLLHNITVLGIDQRSSEVVDEPVVVKVVTLLTTPEQAKTLTLAQQVGNLTLSLRNEGDNGEDDSSTIALNDLWSYGNEDLPPRATASARQAVPKLIQVIRGLEVVKQPVSETDDSAPATVVSN